MFKTLLTTSALTAILATGASAATTNIIYNGQGTPLVNQFIGIDLVGGGDDYSQADGINDINLGENPGSGDTSGRFGVDSRFVEADFLSVFQSGDLARNSDNELILFSNGDSIDDSHFQGTQDTAILYGGTGLNGYPEAPGGILPTAGDSVILGFRFQFTESTYEEFSEVSLTEVVSDEVVCFDEVCDQGEEELVATYFGFMQITRGSVVPGVLGFNSTSGQAAVVSVPTIAPVPLPAAGWMLLAGFGGLAAMKRRKKA